MANALALAINLHLQSISYTKYVFEGKKLNFMF